MSAIDFKLVPVDTLVEVMQHGIVTRYHFAGIVDDDLGFCVYPHGASSKTTSHADKIADTGWYFKQIRVSDKNDWVSWLGGECPVPPNCIVDVILRDTSNGFYPPRQASDIKWAHDDIDNAIEFGDCTDVIAYRLMESPWQTISGVCDE